MTPPGALVPGGVALGGSGRTSSAEAMNVPLKVVFRGMDPSPALEHDIRERVTKLVRFHQKVTSCHVAVEAPGHKGAVFEVRIDLVVPGGQIVVAREPGKNQAHEDPHVALRDAFEAAARQLESFRQRRRHAVKHHGEPDMATAISLALEAPRAR
jgi:ribosome-associated translation inhibitor RaiA